MTTLPDYFRLAENAGLSPVFRYAGTRDWDAVLDSVAYAPFFYSAASLDFQHEYQLSQSGNWQDLSMIIEWDRKPVALFPLSLSGKDGKWAIGCFGMPVLIPLFSQNLAPTTSKKISRSLLAYVDVLAASLAIPSWQSVEYFQDKTGLSEWHATAMANGAKCQVGHDLFIDLQQDLDKIKRGFRKSYKSLVTTGFREWQVSILDNDDPGIWDEFHNLHLDVAGRRTRSHETWQRHYQDIQNERGFLVYLRDAKGRMTGAGFFNHTKDEGMYAVAAYDRRLFDKPLGHVVQYAAIEHLKALGVRWYKLGPRYFPAHVPAPTEKEISIAEFKQGFASHLMPAYYLNHPVGEST